MIYVYGTSHVSKESLELVDEKIDEHDPEIIALELDYRRLNSLLNPNKGGSGGPLFVKAIKWFQERVGKKTGVMPGEEMLYAYNRAFRDGRDVGLIDQDIMVTVKKLGEVSRKEKIKAGAQLLIGFFASGRINLEKIPRDEFIDKLLYELEFKFPELYSVIVEERNQHMIESLKNLQEENPDSDIVAFVGAAHKKAVRQALE